MCVNVNTTGVRTGVCVNVNCPGVHTVNRLVVHKPVNRLVVIYCYVVI